jgi:hypothetical protein
VLNLARTLVNASTVAGLLSLGLLSLLSARPAAAQVVYDNGSSDHISGTYSDTGFPNNLADTFSFAAPTSFNTVEWVGAYAPSNTPPLPSGDNFTITFFSVTAGVIDITPLPLLTFNVGSNVNRTATGFTIAGFTEFVYSSALPGGVSLPAGDYAISIVNDTTADTDDDWSWATSAQNGLHYERTAPPSPG